MAVEYFRIDGTGIELVKVTDGSLSYSLHNHTSVFTVGLLTDGCIRLEIDKRQHSARENDYFVIAPLVPHSICAQGTYSLLSLCIDERLVREDKFHAICKSTAILLDKAFEEEASATVRLPLFQEAFRALQNGVPTRRNDNEYIDRIKDMLIAKPENPLSMEGMSKQSYCSKSYLMRKFKASVGLPPHQFQLQNRVRKAQRLLPQSSSIAEVAQITGFYDQSHFIKTFKKIVGLSPTKYRDALRFVRTGPG